MRNPSDALLSAGQGIVARSEDIYRDASHGQVPGYGGPVEHELALRHMNRPAADRAEPSYNGGRYRMPEQHQMMKPPTNNPQIDYYPSKVIDAGVQVTGTLGHGIESQIPVHHYGAKPSLDDAEKHEWGLGNRILEHRHASKPLGGGVEQGWGVGNRVLEDRHAPKPIGGGVEHGWGIGNRVLEDRHVPKPLHVGDTEKHEWGLGNRILEHRHVSKPLGGGVELGWCLGNRVLEDRHVPKPIGGGVEYGWHIGNRVLEDRFINRPRVRSVDQGYPEQGHQMLEHHLVENAPFASPGARPAVGGQGAGRYVENTAFGGKAAGKPADR